LPLAAALAFAAVPAGSAEGFAGGNGAIGYGWSSLTEPELGTPSSERAIKRISPAGGTPRTLRGCRTVGGTPVAGNCSLQYLDPAFSPNGTRIVFDAGAALALLDADGRSLRLLRAHSEDDGEPWFSPTGTRLVFSAGTSTSLPTGGRREIWVSGIFGDRARRIVSRGTDPVWSARDRIAFVRSGQIWLVRPDGRGLRQVTGRGGSAPAWSPHGTQLAFARRGAVFALDLKRDRLRRVWTAGAQNLAWSPDGRRLVVHVFDSGVWTVGANGRGARQLVAGGVNATSSFDANGVDWQPLR
jgi:TolB protein